MSSDPLEVNHGISQCLGSEVTAQAAGEGKYDDSYLNNVYNLDNMTESVPVLAVTLPCEKNVIHLNMASLAAQWECQCRVVCQKAEPGSTFAQLKW